MIGYLLAFLSSIFFSLYVIPRKLSNQPAIFFSLLMGTGFFVSSVMLYLFQPVLGFDETINMHLWWSVVAGVVWAAGFVCFVKSIDTIGLARSNQWKNLQGPVGVILSLIILGEYAKTRPLFAVLAGVAVFLSAVAFTISSSKAEAKTNLSGIYLATASGVAFGLVTVINKHVVDTVGVYSQQVVWSAAIALSLLIYIVLQKGMLKKLRDIDNRNLFLGLGAGVLYLGASFFMLQSYRYIPASIGFTIIQLNAVWTIGIGIFLFKEINARKYAGRIVAGFIFAILSTLLLAFARL